MKNRIPRKIKKKIPKGYYCYELLSFDWTNADTKVRYCKFHTSIRIGDKPKELNEDMDYTEEELNMYDEWCSLYQCDILDSCKSCSINKK